MRTALISEGGYPYHTCSSSSWCHQLVRGLAPRPFHLTALTRAVTGLTPAYPLPGNVVALAPVPVWSAPVTVPGWRARRRARRAGTDAALLLCQSLAAGPAGAGRFRQALGRLARLAARGAHPLTGTPLAEVLVETWRADRSRPRLTMADARSVAVLLEHAVRPLTVPAPPVQVCHATSAGLPLLVALAAKWRTGTPYLLTEPGIYLRERYLDYGEQLPEAVRAVLLSFFHALARLGYAEAATVVAASRFNQRWQLRHGAHPAKVVVVPGGVDPAEFPARPEPEPAAARVMCLGRLVPSADLPTLLHAFRRVRQELPAAQLRLVGPAPDRRYLADCRRLIRQLGLAESVGLTGPVPHPAPAYTDAQVVVRTSACEGQPYPVIEAMMSGRPVVSTDVGGVAELVGDTGVLVRPGDPAALATALTGLLRDPHRRRALGAAAARRAREQFSLDRMLRAYRELYADAATARRPVDRSRPPVSAPVRRPVEPARTGTEGGH